MKPVHTTQFEARDGSLHDDPRSALDRDLRSERAPRKAVKDAIWANKDHLELCRKADAEIDAAFDYLRSLRAVVAQVRALHS